MAANTGTLTSPIRGAHHKDNYTNQKNAHALIGARDFSIPDDDDHKRHLRHVFTADRRGFAFGVSKPR